MRARSEYAPIVAVLSVMMDRIDAESVGELVHRDPDNALGNYLQGALLHVSSRESEAVGNLQMGGSSARNSSLPQAKDEI